jgi:hypothetical protein
MIPIAKHRARGRQTSRWASWLVLAVWAGVAGCGDPGAPPVVTVYEVKGQVLRADGSPLPGGRVYFVPRDGTTTSEGTIGPDGAFSLSTGRSGEGAPPGDFKVRVEPGDASLLAVKRARGKARALPFPPKYLDEDTSTLTARVETRPNRLEPFRLK